MKWTADKRFVPPFGEFSEGDDVNNLPEAIKQDLLNQGLISDEAQAQASEAPIDAPLNEEV